ncbi:hypothetical protein B0H11DRAFT_1708414, partial [Mycena galericulata]
LATAIIMSTLYGYDVEPMNDRFVLLSEKAVKTLSESFFPRAAAVNYFPFLRHLPGWLPGCGFQQVAAESRKIVQEMAQAPFDFVKKNIEDGIDTKSITAKLLEPSQARGRFDEKMVREVAAVAYAGMLYTQKVLRIEHQ